MESFSCVKFLQEYWKAFKTIPINDVELICGLVY